MHKLLLMLVAMVAVSSVLAAEPQAPAFTRKPTVAKTGAGAKITFAVDRQTDVAVSVENAKGEIIRHLIAGALGKNPPEMLKADALEQSVEWDGKDDAAQPAAGGPFKVRVQLGVGAELDRFIPSISPPMGPVTAIGVGANGELYVLANRCMHGGVSIYVLDREGKYLRTILPSPATLKAEQVKGLDRIKLPGGKEVPIIYNGYTADTAPFMSGMRVQRLEITSQGWIVFASGANDMWDQAVERHAMALKTDGSTPPELAFVGPKLGPVMGYGMGVRRQQLAASPDGKTLYCSGMGLDAYGGNHPAKGVHCVGKLAWDNKEPAVFIGKPDEAGADGEHLNLPESVATDAAGNVLVADFGNNRVAAFSSEGKFLGETKVDKPRYICVHSQTSAMYVLTAPNETKSNRPEPFALVKFDKEIAGKEIGRLDLKGVNPVMALDSAATPTRIWLANDGLFAITDDANKLSIGANIITEVADEFDCPLYMTVDAARDRLYVSDYPAKVYVMAIDLKTDKMRRFLKASEAAVDRDGNVYVLDWYNTNTISRYTPDGKPLPFATGGNTLSIKFRNGLPDVGVKGLTVAPNGDIFAYQDNNMSAPMRLWQFGPDGKLKRDDFIKEIPFDSAAGLAVDHAGNVYAGINIHDANRLYPADFGDQIPPQAWYTRQGPNDGWYKVVPQRKAPDGPPWNRPYMNFYLYEYGSVFKFGPGGGNITIGGRPVVGANPRPDGVPADARELRNAYLSQVVWLAGAKWEYHGFGICPNRTENSGDPGCSCMSSRFGIDEYDRLLVPDVFRCSVGVVDTAGNELTRLGAYGNIDSAGPKSLIPEPAIPLTSPNAVASGGGKIYVADRKSRRIAVLKVKYAADETCEVR